MTRIKHIHQETPYSCSLASIAMIAGMTHAEVVLKGKIDLNTFRGQGMRDDLKLLRKCGVKCRGQMFPELKWGFVYLAAVPSLNVVAGMHRVVFDLKDDDLRVLDPQKGTGKKYYDCYEYDNIKSFNVGGYSDIIRITGGANE